MIKRIKRALKIWEASKHDNVFVTKEKLSDEEMQALAQSLPGGKIVRADEELGDGKAEFFGDPTRDDEIDFEREEAGEKSWYDRILKL